MSPVLIFLVSFVEGYFSRVVPSGCINISNSQSVYLAFRHHYAKEFKIRRAVWVNNYPHVYCYCLQHFSCIFSREEDNDDLVQIMDTHSDILQGMYGEFYISEILTKHPDINRQLVVAEVCLSHLLATFNYLDRLFSIKDKPLLLFVWTQRWTLPSWTNPSSSNRTIF